MEDLAWRKVLLTWMEGVSAPFNLRLTWLKEVMAFVLELLLVPVVVVVIPEPLLLL